MRHPDGWCIAEDQTINGYRHRVATLCGVAIVAPWDIKEHAPDCEMCLAKQKADENITRESYTCYDCQYVNDCPYAYDDYNLDGACLADAKGLTFG